jgi:hypothetical protein
MNVESASAPFRSPSCHARQRWCQTERAPDSFLLAGKGVCQLLFDPFQRGISFVQMLDY